MMAITFNLMGCLNKKKGVNILDVLFFLRCLETAMAIVGMTLAIGLLHRQAHLRLVVSLIILTSSCLLMTVIYQQFGSDLAKKIFVPMILIVIGGLVFLNSADKFWVTCFNFLTQYMLYSGITMICTLIDMTFFDSNRVLYLLIRGIAFTLVFYLQIKFVRKPFRYVVNTVNAGWRLASLIVFLFALLSFVLCVYPTMYYERGYYVLIEILIVYSTFAVVLYSTYISLRSAAKRYDQLQSELDLKEKAKYMEVFKLLSETDPLTGLLNRRAFQEQAETCLADDETAVLLFMDIDNFKAVNDTFGHSVGDEALTLLTYALITSFRKTDLIARSGGDEFIVLVRNIQDEEETIEKKIESFYENLNRKIVENPALSDFSVSIGIATMKTNDDFRKIYTNADHAMYQAKKTGEKCSVFYAEDMTTSLVDGLV